MNQQEPPRYEEHSGTIRISGMTLPKNAGFCAMHCLREGKDPIDFLCIGANANQQATKAMGVFAFMVRESADLGGLMEVAFTPILVRTTTKDVLTGLEKEKSATVWRTVKMTKT